MVDTRLSFTRSQWTTTLYVNNVTDNRGITSYQDPAIFGNRAQAIVSQPRTVGLTVGYSLKAR
jgi:outer membrane receptor protein involved in Fe transport